MKSITCSESAHGFDVQRAALALIFLLCGCRDATQGSASMAPTIKAGEKVSVDYTACSFTSPKRWDAVLFEPPMFTNEVWIKRIVGLPGETIAFARGGITINGQPLALPRHLTNVTYLSPGSASGCADDLRTEQHHLTLRRVEEMLFRAGR